MNSIAIGCVAALGLLVFGGGLAVSMQRMRAQQITGFDPDPTDPLYKAVRAHGNTIEYAPFLAVLMLYLGAHAPAPWVTWTMVAATASRYLLVIGMVAYPTMAKPNPPRFFGALGTYVFGLMLCFALPLAR